MTIRLANRNDARQLANLHEQSSAKQPGSFMFKLGQPFLEQYYKALIDEGSSIILCATDDADRLMGFVAGSLDAGSRIVALKKHMVKLGLAALPTLIRHPSLILEVTKRKNSSSPENGESGYVLQKGAHEEFWAFLPGQGGGAIDLHLRWLSLMTLLGAETVSGEVDKVNTMVVKTHRLLGAKVIETFVTPDGRERILIQYRLGK